MFIGRTLAASALLLVAACSKGDQANQQVQANDETMMGNDMMANGMMGRESMTNQVAPTTSTMPADGNAAVNEHIAHHDNGVVENQ